MDSKVLPLSAFGVGAYLAWFGVHYWRSNVTWPTDPVKAVLTGKPLPDNTRTDTTTDVELEGVAGPLLSEGEGAAGTVPSANGPIGQQIASKALSYVGQAYVYGGRADHPGNWDCSSFVSWVLGHDFGIPLPGGKWGDPGFPPNSHGPTTYNYMVFGQGIELSEVQAGDLIVSVEHIAIATSPTQMVSAQDAQLGVGTSSFPGGFPSGPPIYRRITQLAPAETGPVGSGHLVPQ